MRPSTRRLLRASLVVLGAGAGLLLAEAGLRVRDASSSVGDAHGLHQARPDRAWLYGLRPGAVRRVPAMADVVYRVNADGFRDREWVPTKPPQISGADGPVPGQLRALGARRGWLIVDLLPAFRRAATGASPLFLDIWHPTPFGHRLAARETAAALACRGLLPVAPGDYCAREP